MNRYREDTAYTFRPPKYSPRWAPLLRRLSDAVYLRRIHNVREVRVVGGGREALDLCRRGDAVLVTPNHSDHADPHVALHLGGQWQIPLHFMAARETFELSRGLNGVVMQRVGAFSIDREGSDLRAIKEAIRILSEARFPLVMFPEGEIYHLNERLTPLNDGAATLALRAAKMAAKGGSGRGAWILPMAIRYLYIDDIAASFPARLSRLERHILWQPQAGLPIVDRIYKFGEALLALKEREYLGRGLHGDLAARLREFRELLLGEEEQRYFAGVDTADHPRRVRRLRGKIRSILLDGERPAPEVIAQCYRSLDRIYFALQLYSYPGQYLTQKPSADRVAETLHKFEEDVFGENRILGRRRVEVTFCPPVDLVALLPAYAADAKQTVLDVTTRLESAIRTVLEGPDVQRRTGTAEPTPNPSAEGSPL